MWISFEWNCKSLKHLYVRTFETLNNRSSRDGDWGGKERNLRKTRCGKNVKKSQKPQVQREMGQEPPGRDGRCQPRHYRQERWQAKACRYQGGRGRHSENGAPSGPGCSRFGRLTGASPV